MTSTLDQMYELLPAIYRIRDAEQGEPLRALLQVISEQVDVVEQNIAQSYENWFIETCDDWVVPYIGDLIGYQLLVDTTSNNNSAQSSSGKLRDKLLIPRREIANTLRYRRRKGSLALLENLATDVANWPARAVEFYRLLGWTQHLNYLRPTQGRTVDLRNTHALQRIDSPFDELAHSIDVRRIDSGNVLGRYNIAAIGVFVWRLQSYSVTQSSACCVESIARIAILLVHWVMTRHFTITQRQKKMREKIPARLQMKSIFLCP